jgi:hypothetical protein
MTIAKQDSSFLSIESSRAPLRWKLAMRGQISKGNKNELRVGGCELGNAFFVIPPEAGNQYFNYNKGHSELCPYIAK